MTTFYSGESLTILVRFNQEFDIATLTKLQLRIGNFLAYETGQDIESTVDPRVFVLMINSSATTRLVGTYRIQAGIQTTTRGIDIIEAGVIFFEQSNGFTNSVTSPSPQLEINITQTNEVITIDTQISNALRGYSAYDIAVQEGFTGTQAEWLASITASSLIVTVAVAAKGNGDIITHGLGANLRIITFYDDADGGRQRNDFFANGQTLTKFTLNNDFTNDKFTGTLLCVKY